MDEEPGGLGRSDECREFFGGGRADFLYRTEMAQQELYGLRADSFDIFQFTVNESFASLLPVEGDAEAMGFVADVTHHFERFTRTAQVVGHRVPGEEDLFDPLGQAYDGDLFFDSQFAQHGIGAGELSFAAVHDNQVGQFGSFGDQAAVTAEDDLAHRGEVVCTDDGFDVEMAVLLA